MRSRGAGGVEQIFHSGVQNQVWRAGIARAHFHVLPADPAAPAGPERLEHCFFRGKARGIMFRRHRAAALAIRALSGGEDACAKARRALQHFANARNFDNVYADGNDHK